MNKYNQLLGANLAWLCSMHEIFGLRFCFKDTQSLSHPEIGLGLGRVIKF